MARTPSTFRQRDLTAAVKAVVAAGQKVTRVVVEKDGRIVLTTAVLDDVAPANGSAETPEDLRKLL